MGFLLVDAGPGEDGMHGGRRERDTRARPDPVTPRARGTQYAVRRSEHGRSLERRSLGDGTSAQGACAFIQGRARSDPHLRVQGLGGNDDAPGPSRIAKTGHEDSDRLLVWASVLVFVRMCLDAFHGARVLSPSVSALYRAPAVSLLLHLTQGEPTR